MAEYRAYTVGSDGRFIDTEPLVCADNSEAIQKAKRLINGHDVELWSGSRFGGSTRTFNAKIRLLTTI